MTGIWESIINLLSVVKLWTVIPQGRGGVRLRCGRLHRTLGPGFHWQCPIIDDMSTIVVCTQAVNLPNQSITLEDGQSVALSGAIEYSITDAAAALLNVHDLDVAIQNLAMGVLAEQVSALTFPECDRGHIEEVTIGEMKERCDRWGVLLSRVWITDIAKHRVFRLLTTDTPKGLGA